MTSTKQLKARVRADGPHQRAVRRIHAAETAAVRRLGGLLAR